MKNPLLFPCLAIALMLGAQITPPAPNTAEPPGHPIDPLSRDHDSQMAMMRNNSRQQQIQADAAKLLQLSQELKAEVDKSNKNELSLSVVKKAEEIEKLAKAVKIRMRDGY
jgi:type VI protein secretion system component VasF